LNVPPRPILIVHRRRGALLRRIKKSCGRDGSGFVRGAFA
jgi:hypothetical protein